MTSGRPAFRQRAKRAEGSDTTPASHTRKGPVCAERRSRNFGRNKKRSRSPAGPRRLGTATRISASLSRRLSAFFGSTHGQAPKAAKFAVLPPGHAGFPNRVKRSEGSDTTPIRNAPCFGVCALVCDFSRRAECVPAFAHESERGAFVPEVLKTVWTMCWKRWYDCVSCAFHGFFEDEKESRIKGWRRNRRRSRHFCPQCGQLTGVSTQSVVASFEGNFRAAGVLVPANAGVPRILVVPCGRFGRKSR